MLIKKIGLTALRLVGIKKVAYHKKDVVGNTIWMCTKCSCHFIGEACPSMKHR